MDPKAMMDPKKAVREFQKRLIAVIASQSLADSEEPAVRLSKLGPPSSGWKLVAPMAVGGSDFWWEPRALRFGGERIDLAKSKPDLMIIRAGVTQGEMHIEIMEAKTRYSKAIPDRDSLSKLFAESFDEPARAIVAQRAFRHIRHIVEQSPREAIEEAATAPSDTGVLVRTLEEPDAVQQLKAEDPLAQARIRGLQERDRLLSAEGGTLTGEQVAAHLHLTRQAVNRRRKQGALVGVDAGRHGYLYPAWQFGQGGTVTWLKPVLETLGAHDPWMQQAFMVNRNIRLEGLSPIDALRAGRLENVLRVARTYGEHGAA